MTLKPNNYMPRLIDKKIEDLLQVSGAISIEGPKWCGKTFTSLNHASSVINMDDEETRSRFMLNPELVLNESKPELIDEWTREPTVWDKIRRKCDLLETKGNYILSCSTSLLDENKIFHSGAGRISRLKMNTMSLFESNDSSGDISIMDMYEGREIVKTVKKISLEELADLIIRGGWPANINVAKDKYGLMPKYYINSILEKDIYESKNVDSVKMQKLLKSLARNESTVVSNNKLIKDISDNDDLNIDKRTVSNYIEILEKLNLFSNQLSYSTNYRSPERVGKNVKRHFTDPSLAAVLLNMNANKLIADLKTFGFLFEALVERDLKIYMDYLDGNLYHFRDNVTGLEVDSILEFPDGEYAAVEIKLGFNQFNEACDSLLKFQDNVTKKPKFMCVICGYNENIVKDLETGIYIVPITALKPE